MNQNTLDIINLIQDNRDALIEGLREADAAAYRNTNCEYRVYIDSDGEIGREEWPAGSCSYCSFPGNYSRTYVGTLCHQYFSLLDDYGYQGTNLREDDCTDAENEAAMQEALDDILWSWEAEREYDAMIDAAIDDIKYWGRDE